MATDRGYLPHLSSREDYVDYLEGHARPTVDELKQRRLTRKPVKTYMLETVRHGAPRPDLADVFPERVRLDRLDDTLFRVLDHEHPGGVIGLLESLDDRHPVLHTTMAADESDRWVRQVVDTNPWLDRLWLSSTILYQLWEYVRRTAPPHRYVRLGFDHEAWYESPRDMGQTDVEPVVGNKDEDDDEDDVDASIRADQDEDDSPVRPEHRRSKVQLTERLSVLDQSLPGLIDLYDPLHSLVQLQIPSGGRGGHRLHFDGKATNRSDSFVEHRATVSLVVEMYRRVTEHAEDRLWVDSTSVGDDGFLLTGAPLLVRFSKPLSPLTFDRFINLGLQRKTSRFRIGGYLHRRGPTKVHLAAIDRHLWQPFLLEVTSRQLLAVLPSGTCGNTIHRMVTNVQRFLDPDVQVWLGSQSYQDAVTASFGLAV